MNLNPEDEDFIKNILNGLDDPVPCDCPVCMIERGELPKQNFQVKMGMALQVVQLLAIIASKLENIPEDLLDEIGEGIAICQLTAYKKGWKLPETR